MVGAVVPLAPLVRVHRKPAQTGQLLFCGSLLGPTKASPTLPQVPAAAYSGRPRPARPQRPAAAVSPPDRRLASALVPTPRTASQACAEGRPKPRSSTRLPRLRAEKAEKPSQPPVTSARRRPPGGSATRLRKGDGALVSPRAPPPKARAVDDDARSPRPKSPSSRPVVADAPDGTFRSKISELEISVSLHPGSASPQNAKNYDVSGSEPDANIAENQPRGGESSCAGGPPPLADSNDSNCLSLSPQVNDSCVTSTNFSLPAMEVIKANQAMIVPENRQRTEGEAFDFQQEVQRSHCQIETSGDEILIVAGRSDDTRSEEQSGKTEHQEQMAQVQTEEMQMADLPRDALPVNGEQMDGLDDKHTQLEDVGICDVQQAAVVHQDAGNHVTVDASLLFTSTVHVDGVEQARLSSERFHDKVSSGNTTTAPSSSRETESTDGCNTSQELADLLGVACARPSDDVAIEQAQCQPSPTGSAHLEEEQAGAESSCLPSPTGSAHSAEERASLPSPTGSRPSEDVAIEQAQCHPSPTGSAHLEEEQAGAESSCLPSPTGSAHSAEESASLPSPTGSAHSQEGQGAETSYEESFASDTFEEESEEEESEDDEE